MALSFRHLTLLAAALVAAPLAFVANAQTSRRPTITFRAIAVGDSAATSGLCYEDRGKSVGLAVTTTGLSQPCTRPASDVLTLYRELPPESPGQPPRRATVAEVRFEKPGDHLLVLTALREGAKPVSVRALAMDDSWRISPAETVRVFNFCRRKLAVQLGADTPNLAPGQSHVSPFSKGDDTIEFKVATWESSSWKTRFNSALGVIPKTRLLIVISDRQPTPDDPHPSEISIDTIYDTMPPAEPKPAPGPGNP